QAIQFEDVVRGAHQRPFALELRDAAQQELAKASRLLDLSQYRFDDRLASGVDRGARLRQELSRHPLDARGGLRQGPTRTGPRAFAVFLLARRDVRVDSSSGDRSQVLVRAVPRVRGALG